MLPGPSLVPGQFRLASTSEEEMPLPPRVILDRCRHRVLLDRCHHRVLLDRCRQ